MSEKEGKKIETASVETPEAEPFSHDEARKLLKNARHKAEIPLTVLAVVLTVGILAFISYMAVTARGNEEVMEFLTKFTGFEKPIVQFILRAGGDIALAVIVYLLAMLVQQNMTFLGKVLSNEMRLSDSRFSYLKEYYEDCVKACGMKNAPELFIVGTEYQSEVLGVPVRSNNVLAIDKKMILKAEQTGDWGDVEYSVAKRLAKIHLGYCSLPNQMFTFCIKLIPGLKQLFSRCRTYSIDRVVMALLGREKAFENVFCECYDVDLYRDLDRKEIIDNKTKSLSRAEEVSKSLENFGSEAPIAPYRLKAMLDTETDGRLL